MSQTTAAPPTPDRPEPPARVGIMPENVSILIMVALVTGLLLGQAIGRRQGLKINQVVLPDHLAHAAVAAEHDHDHEHEGEGTPGEAPAGAMGGGAAEASGADARVDAMKTKMDEGVTAPPLDMPKDLPAAEAMVARMGINDPATLLQFGRSQLDDDNPWLALGFLDQAVKTDPKLAEAWGLLGRGYHTVGQAAESREAWQQYLALAPSGEMATEARRALEGTAAPR